MKNLIKAKRLECTLDNPLFPTIATLHLPEMELKADECVEKGKSFSLKIKEKINIEIDQQEEMKSSFIETRFFPLAKNDASLLLELEDPALGLTFKVGMDQNGQVNKISANWLRAS